MKKAKLFLQIMVLSFLVFRLVPNAIKQIVTVYSVFILFYIVGHFSNIEEMEFVARVGMFILLFSPALVTYVHFIKPINEFKPDRLVYQMVEEREIVVGMYLQKGDAEYPYKINELAYQNQSNIQLLIICLTRYINLHP